MLYSDIEFVNNSVVQGSRLSKSWAQEQHIYFYAEFSKAFRENGISVDDTLYKGMQSAEGNNIKAYVKFCTEENEEIFVRIAISAVSIKGAKKNFDAEINERSFDEVKIDAENIWEKELSKIDVEGGTKEQKTIFYTALYHSFTAPNLFQDVDGKYRGTDLKVHQSEGHTNYTVFSLWDTYRATHPLYTIIQQNRTNDFITFANSIFSTTASKTFRRLEALYKGLQTACSSICSLFSKPTIVSSSSLYVSA